MTCTRFLIPNRRGNGVRLTCTCGMSHGARSWNSFAMAIEELKARGFKFSAWFNNPSVHPMCRDYAEKGTGFESLRQVLSLKV